MYTLNIKHEFRSDLYCTTGIYSGYYFIIDFPFVGTLKVDAFIGTLVLRFEEEVRE